MAFRITSIGIYINLFESNQANLSKNKELGIVLTLNQQVWERHASDWKEAKKKLIQDPTLEQILSKLNGDLAPLEQQFYSSALVARMMHIDGAETQIVRLVRALPLEIFMEVRGNLTGNNTPTHEIKRDIFDWAVRVNSGDGYEKPPQSANAIPTQYFDQKYNDVLWIQKLLFSEPTEIGNTTRTAERLAAKTKGKPILMISIGNGSLLSGYDVFARYDAANGGSEFYPIRMSSKMRDFGPLITENDIAALNCIANGREVVIFDSIEKNGYTLGMFETFMHKVMEKSPGYAVVPVKKINELETGIVRQSRPLPLGYFDWIENDGLRVMLKKVLYSLTHPLIPTNERKLITPQVYEAPSAFPIS